MNLPANPYAPPAAKATIEPAPQLSPLPEGFRRYRLEPTSYRALLRKAVRLRTVIMTVTMVGYLMIVIGLGIIQQDYVWTSIGVLAVVWALTLWRLRVVTRKTEARALASFEILMSPRALRRVSILPPAEMLFPEITSIVEVKGGLSIASTTPPSRFFVSSAVADYADLRARLAAVRPIESAAGFASFVRRLGHIGTEKLRQEAYGTSLANDAALREELAILRAASAAVPIAHIIRPKRILLRVVLLWALLLVMFFALWQFFAPSTEDRPRDPRPAQTSETP